MHTPDSIWLIPFFEQGGIQLLNVLSRETFQLQVPKRWYEVLLQYALLFDIRNLDILYGRNDVLGKILLVNDQVSRFGPQM